MTEQIRDIATVTFSGKRFEGPGIEPDVFSILLAYCELLIETAKELSERQFAVRMKFYPLENPRGVVIRKIVMVDDSCVFSEVGTPDAIDEAAQLIDETLFAVRKRRRIPSQMPKRVLSMLAALADDLQQGETITTRAARSKTVGDLTRVVRERLLAYASEAASEVPAVKTGRREWILRDAPAVPFKRVSVQHDLYDDSVPPLWQTVAALGASLSEEEWKDVPADLAENLDHYLYGSASDT